MDKKFNIEDKNFQFVIIIPAVETRNYCFMYMCSIYNT